MEAKCKCWHCNGSLSFDPEHAGTRIPCPHCGSETQLFIPPPTDTKPEPPRSGSIQTPAASTAAIETTLEEIGDLFFYAGIFGLIGFGIASFFAFSNQQMLVAGGLLISAIASLAQGFIIQALFKALAEIIRLLRAIKAKP